MNLICPLKKSGCTFSSTNSIINLQTYYFEKITGNRNGAIFNLLTSEVILTNGVIKEVKNEENGAFIYSQESTITGDLLKGFLLKKILCFY